jgi:hypothetical protein
VVALVGEAESRCQITPWWSAVSSTLYDKGKAGLRPNSANLQFGFRITKTYLRRLNGRAVAGVDCFD